MGLPTPQFNTPLSPNQINPELSWYPIYGVTPDNKYTPISITENGQLSIGSVTISGPVTISDVVIKGVDPANSFVSEDVAVYNLGVGNGFSMRSTLFDGANHLAINPDGSINFSSLSIVTAKIEDSSGNTLNSTSGSLNVNVTNIVPVILPTLAGFGQTTIVTTGTAVNLASNPLVNGVVVSANISNVSPIVIGLSSVTNVIDGSGNGYVLAPGASIGIAVSNTNSLWVNGTANDVVSFVGS